MKPDIEKLIKDSKPDTRFDKRFAKELRAQLLGKPSTQIINIFKHMTNVYKFAGGTIVVLIVAFGIYSTMQDSSKLAFAPEVNKVSSNAFGSLLAQDGKGEIVQEGAGIGAAAPSDESAASQLGTDAAISSSAMFGGFGGGGGIAVESRMIMPSPYSEYKYVYAGEDFTLENNTVSVLRRQTGESSASSFADKVKGLNFGIINLSSFSSTKVENVSFKEDKDFGYRVDINFRDNSISIYENWEKWKNPMNECSDQECYDRHRLTISDVPSDTELISIANNFLSTYGISADAYSQPEVVDDWRRNYEETEDKEKAWIPDQIQVRYALIIDDEIVHDQGGNPTGMTVNVNIRHNRAAGVWGLRANQFESSDYEAVTSVDDIKKIVEAGGMGHIIEPEKDAKVLELGTPEQILLQTHNWSEGKSNELFVPALKFPITNKPEGVYFWRDSIIVPLAKELLEQQLPEPRPMPVDDVIIMDRGDSVSSDGE